MYRIEMVMADRYGVIYHQNGSDAALPCYGPKLSLEVNQAGSLSFTVLKTHPLIDEMWPLSGYVRVIENGDELFYGRILQRTENRITGSVEIQCEGSLAFLLDSEIPPYGYDSDGNQITKTQTPKQFFIDAISNHNSEIKNDWRRRFQLGEITAKEAEESCKYTISNYTQTKSAIQTSILDAHGGFLFTYPAENGYDHYIDWVEKSTRLNTQQISLGKNVEEMSHQFDSNELFTVIRPYYTTSKNKPQYLPEETLDLYDEDDYVNKYGRIVKTLEFKDATDEASLRSKAETYIENMHKTLYGSISVQYIDMRYLDGTSPVVRLGDRFNNLVGLWGEEYMVSSMEIDMDHPENSTLQLDNPKTLKPNLTPEGESRSTNSTKSSISKKTNQNAAATIKHITDLEDKMTIAVNELDIQVKSLNINVEGQFRETASQFERISSRVSDINGVVETDHHFIEGVNYKVETMEGTAVIQNSDFISNLAGKFEVWTGADGKVTVHLVDGADLSVDDVNGVTQSVGTRLAQVIENGLVIDTIEGSALWTQRDNITGICGEYDIIVDPVTGKKTLVVKSGGGMKIRRNNVEYGIYDEGNLDGGLLVQKLADGTVSTTISGDIINLNTNDDYASLKLSNDGLQTTVAEHTTSINTMGVSIEAFEGSALWEQRDNITGVCGEYEVVTDTTTGEKTLVIKAGGGMKIRRNNVEYGLYDNGNLTGGIVVDKLRDGSVVTKIPGDIVDITATQMAGIGVWTDSNKTEKAGLMIEAINGYTESTINTDRLTFSGTSVNLADKVKIRAEDSINHIYFDDNNVIFGSSISSIARIVNGEVRSHGYYYYTTNQTGDGEVTGYTGIIKKAEVDGNTLKIWKFGDPENTPSINFKKATSLIKTWGGTEGSPSSNSNTLSIVSDDVTPHSIEDSVQVFLTRSEEWNGNTRTIYLTHTDSELTHSIAKIDVDASGRYTAGRNATKVSGPTWSTAPSASITGTSNTATFTTDAPSPNSGASKSLGLYLSRGDWDGNTRYVYLTHTDSTDANRIARISIDASERYKAGQNAVSVSGPTWSTAPSASITGTSNTATFTTDAPSPNSGASKSLGLYLSRGDWDGNTRYVYLSHTDTTNANRIARISVDASSIYTNGYNSARLLPTWSNNKLTISKTDSTSYGTSYDLYVVASQGTPSYSSSTHKYTITATAKAGTSVAGATSRSTDSVTTGTEAYTGGWTDCYDTFDSSGTTATKELAYGEAAVVTVKQKNKDGSVITRLDRTYTTKIPSHTITAFEVYRADAGQAEGESGNGYTNNSDGYYISGSSRNATVKMVIGGRWYCDGVFKSGNRLSYVSAEPIYQKGWDNGSSSASHRISSFDTTNASTSETYNNLTNNSDGFYISGDGIDASAYIVTKSTWKCDGESQSELSYLKGATTKLYKEAFLRGWANYYDDPDWWEQPSASNGYKCYIPNRNRSGKVLWFTTSSGSDYTSLGSGWYYTVTALTNGKYKHSFVLEMASNSWKGLKNETNYTLYK